MKCPQCQSENREGAKFCNECGHKFQVGCPSCGNSNRAGSKSCDEYGHGLRKSEKTRTLEYNQPQNRSPRFFADKFQMRGSSIEDGRKLVAVQHADAAGSSGAENHIREEGEYGGAQTNTPF